MEQQLVLVEYLKNGIGKNQLLHLHSCKGKASKSFQNGIIILEDRDIYGTILIHA